MALYGCEKPVLQSAKKEIPGDFNGGAGVFPWEKQRRGSTWKNPWGRKQTNTLSGNPQIGGKETRSDSDAVFRWDVSERNRGSVTYHAGECASTGI